MDVHLDHEFTLNPDGSGKVELRWRGPEPESGVGPEGFMKSEVEGARGVDVWGAMSIQTEEGCMTFEATAYFRDIAALAFHCQGFHSDTIDFALTRNEAGDVVVEHRRTGEGRADGPEPSPAGDEPMDDAALRSRLAEEREKFVQIRGFIESLFGPVKVSARLNLPGEIGSLENGQRLSDRSVGVEIDCQQILGFLDRLMGDDELMMKAIREGFEGPDDFQRILGVQGLLRVVTTGDVAPTFDYDAETESARAWFEEFSASLGAAAGSIGLPSEGPPLGGTRIIALKLVLEADGDRDLTPMSQNSPGLTVTVAGELPDGVVDLVEAHVVRAVTDGGQDLAQEKGGDIWIAFPKMTKDRRTAFLDVDLPAPPEGTRGLAEVRGSLRCHVAGGAEDVDLGFQSLEPEAEGTEMGARILSIEDSSWEEGKQNFTLRLEVSRSRVESISMADGQGDPVEISSTGYSAMNDTCELNFSVDGKVPADGRIVARVFTRLQTIDAPFVVVNVDLLGRPGSG